MNYLKFHNKIFIFMKKTDLAENGTEREYIIY